VIRFKRPKIVKNMFIVIITPRKIRMEILTQVENGNEHLFRSYELMFIVIITAHRKILLAV
jgi:hypothetical protein